MSIAKSVIVALDLPGYEQAVRLAQALPPSQCRVKVGKALFTRCGTRIIDALHDLGHEIFLDLKYHDIPNTASEAVVAAADLGVWMVNVHAGGGIEMLRAAQQALVGRDKRPLLIAVTVLTSTSPAMLRAQGVTRSLDEQVEFLTQLSAEAGLDGVVCSAQEAATIKQQYGQAFLAVTPGIRPVWAGQDDQMRIMTPRAAQQAGSDYLVIGRPISRADDPGLALQRVLDELNTG